MDVVDWIIDSDEENEMEEFEFIINGLPRRIYERANPFYELDDVEFFMRFRLCKATVLDLLNHIEENLEYPYDTYGELMIWIYLQYANSVNF